MASNPGATSENPLRFTQPSALRVFKTVFSAALIPPTVPRLSIPCAQSSQRLVQDAHTSLNSVQIITSLHFSSTGSHHDAIFFATNRWTSSFFGP